MIKQPIKTLHSACHVTKTKRRAVIGCTRKHYRVLQKLAASLENPDHRRFPEKLIISDINQCNTKIFK